VLAVARLLSDHHDLRAGTALSEYRLRGIAEQVATLTVVGGLRERGQRALLRKKVGGGAFRRLARHLGSTSTLRSGDADVPAVSELRAHRTRTGCPTPRQAAGRGAPGAPRAAHPEL